MIGAGKLIIVSKGAGGGGPPPPPALNAYVSPTNVTTFAKNGAATSAVVEVTASGGAAPYTYAWEVDNNFITAKKPANKETAFSSSGFDRERIGTAECTVTDNVGATKVVSCRVAFFFSASGNELA